VVGFDLTFLDRKCKEWNVPFRLGRGGATAAVLPPLSARQQAMARIPGRVVLDGIALLRLGFWNFERFSLEVVARDLLGRGKDIKDPGSRLYEIRRMFREDPDALARYNLEDCRLVLDVFAKADLIRFAVERSKLTGLPMDRYGGSVAAFDYLYLPRLHREGAVAPDVGSITNPVESPGGYVMDSKPGLYDNVLVLDFKSLYPSIIRTFKIDPLGLAQPGADPVPGFVGATFNREKSILPDLIASLWASRDEAKRQKNQALQLAIKIIMNSFYGVLGSTGCRFFNPKLASSITKRGHELLTRSKDFIEQQGYGVIYGDTDSLFVLIGPDKNEEECGRIGRELADFLNEWWTDNLRNEFQIQSHLEIEFETHYIRFFMPTIRGSEVGSKKRYAGYVRNAAGEHAMMFKGLESVRTDWTPLAREFQQELYRRIFFKEPYEDYMRTLVEEMLSGAHDDALVYRKRIRRKLDDYTKNVPPHVQAARKLEKVGKWVEYVITINGPEPIQKIESPLDYAHYLDRQLAPVADTILHLFNTSFESITGKQMDLF
jgi:DNA polymerase II